MPVLQVQSFFIYWTYDQSSLSYLKRLREIKCLKRYGCMLLTLPEIYEHPCVNGILDNFVIPGCKAIMASKPMFTHNLVDKLCGNLSLCEKCPYLKFFWSVFSRTWTEYGNIRSIQSKRGKIQTRKTPSTDTFHAVCLSRFLYGNKTFCRTIM